MGNQGFYGFPARQPETAPSFAATLVSAVGAGARFVGGTSGGAPASGGPFRVRDFVIDDSAAIWVCTTAGSPGTWVQAGGTSPLSTKGDLFGYDTAGNRVPIGSDGQVLVADSTQTLGLGWKSGYGASAPAPAVRCYNSAAISTSSGAWTSLTFDSNRYDQGPTAQHSTSSNTSRLTCRQAGIYDIGATAYVTAMNVNSLLGIRLRLNGSTILVDEIVNTTTSNGDVVLNVSCHYQLSVGDYAEVQVLQSSGTSKNVVADPNESPEFWMARLDAAGSPNAFPALATKTANYTLGSSDTVIVAGANSLTLTLPSASSAGAGRFFVIKNGNFTSTTVARSGSDAIDGATSYSLSAAYNQATFVSDGSSAYYVL